MSEAREEKDGRCLSDSDDQDDGKQENDWNDWEEDDATPSKCLLCPVMLNSVDEALHHGTGTPTIILRTARVAATLGGMLAVCL
jgi:hypothetical protein